MMRLHTVFICINAPGAMHFSKGGGGGDYYQKKNYLSSPVAMGNNEHLQLLISLVSMYNDKKA